MRKRIVPAFDAHTNIPNLILFPIHVPIELPRTVFPERGQQVDVRTDFVQEETLRLQCLTKILPTCVVEDISINLDTLTWDFLGMFLQLWNVFHFYLGASRYCVGGLSCTIRQSRNDIHLFCSCHFRTCSGNTA